jgi:zinc transport system ATP-binding protein
MINRTCRHLSTTLESVSISLAGKPVIKDVSLQIACGDLLAIIGPNGAGKTTLLRAILGEIPFQGSIRFEALGERVRKPLIGYVPQQVSVEKGTPTSVEDLLVMAIGGSPFSLLWRPMIRRQVLESLERVQAGHLLKERLSDLSGGELQRVLLAAAITPLPDLLLLDEPVSGVDPQGLELFYQLVNELREKRHLSIIIVTHDLAGIAPHADRMVLLKESVLASGTAEEVLKDDALIRTFGPKLLNVATLLEAK